MKKLETPVATALLDGLNQAIEPVEQSSGYSMGLFGAVAVMIFMIFTYVTMIALLFWILLNLFFHVFSLGSRSFSLVGIALNGSLFVIGVCVFLALIKPLFSRKDGESEEFLLHPKQEPLLFEFVNRICKSVGAPAPTQISVDPNVNAGARFVSGVMDRRMQLQIGLPLVLAFDTRQLAGVIAHEFGHFSQTTGMRLAYMVRSIDNWFCEAAFQRDAWDEQVESLSNSSNSIVSTLFKAVRFAVWAARFVLLMLVYVGHFFVSHLLRQMEFDADRHEARLVGSQYFAKTARQMQLLNFCQAEMMDELSHYRRTKQLPDDLPALLVDNQKFIDPKVFREIEEKLLSLKTAWDDSHPSDRDRIENAARENTDGIFTVEYPATELFSDVVGLSKVVTSRTYQDMFGEEFKPSQVRSTDELIASRAIRRTEGKAALRFALEQFCGYDTFELLRSQLGQAIDSQSYKQNTVKRRKQLLEHVRAYAKIRQQEDQIRDDMVSATCARRLIEAGFDLSGAADVIQVRTIQQSHQALQRLAAKDQQVKKQLRPFRQVLGARLIDALEFMRAEKMVQACGESADVNQKIEHILKVWNCVIGLRATFDAFFFEAQVNSLLLHVAEDHLNEKVERSIYAASSRLRQSMVQIQQATTHLMYPFEHGLGKVSLAHFLVPELPSSKDIMETMGTAVDLDQNLEFLLKRCVARLGSLAETVETTFGFAPLETPAEILEMAKQEPNA